MSALSRNTPSTPRRKNSRSSAGRSPGARRNSGLAGLPWRKSRGRKLFSLRNVHGWTTRPARWASGNRLGRAGRGAQVGVAPRVAGDHEVVGPADGVDELDQRQPGLAVQLLEVGRLEG